MSSAAFIDRRGFVAGCAGVAGLCLLPAGYAAPSAVDSLQLTNVSVIIDPQFEAAATFGAALSQRGAQRLMLRSDAYRFIRTVLATNNLATTIVGMGTYADLIVATGALREARYAMVAHGQHALSHAHHFCFGEWADHEHTLQRSAAAWPEALADIIGGGATKNLLAVAPRAERPRAERPQAGGPRAGGPRASHTQNTGSVFSWVMQSTSLRRLT